MNREFDDNDDMNFDDFNIDDFDENDFNVDSNDIDMDDINIDDIDVNTEENDDDYSYDKFENYNMEGIYNNNESGEDLDGDEFSNVRRYEDICVNKDYGNVINDEDTKEYKYDESYQNNIGTNQQRRNDNKKENRSYYTENSEVCKCDNVENADDYENVGFDRDTNRCRCYGNGHKCSKKDDVHSKDYKCGYQKGYQRGYQDGFEAGYDKAKQEVIDYVKAHRRCCRRGR